MFSSTQVYFITAVASRWLSSLLGCVMDRQSVKFLCILVFIVESLLTLTRYLSFCSLKGVSPSAEPFGSLLQRKLTNCVDGKLKESGGMWEGVNRVLRWELSVIPIFCLLRLLGIHHHQVVEGRFLRQRFPLPRSPSDERVRIEGFGRKDREERAVIIQKV